MITEGATAPDFTAPLADGDVTTFTLSEHLDEAPIILAFFPGAFTSTCTTELQTFQTDHDEFESLGATLYGVSIDTPFSLNKYREVHGFSFGFISDANRDIITAYDVQTDFADIALYDIAKRAVFIVNSDQEITYAWVTDDPSREPAYDAVKAAVAVTAE